jgi:hypothetical protein
MVDPRRRPPSGKIADHGVPTGIWRLAAMATGRMDAASEAGNSGRLGEKANICSYSNQRA